MVDEWGPLGPLVGEWESDRGGLDTAFSHEQEKVLDTPYLEKVTFKPFGPVDNGKQHLYGLDYKKAMWRDNEDDPFHTEVGYWLWDGATGENKYLADHASTLSYTVTITTNGGDTWSYDETTMLEMDEIKEPFAHTDHNTLHKVG